MKRIGDGVRRRVVRSYEPLVKGAAGINAERLRAVDALFQASLLKRYVRVAGRAAAVQALRAAGVRDAELKARVYGQVAKVSDRLASRALSGSETGGSDGDSKSDGLASGIERELGGVKAAVFGKVFHREFRAFMRGFGLQ
ncbi:MAG: hypothetical protein AABW54_05135 [Candidatus Micrarchaeota archaeon]